MGVRGGRRRLSWVGTWTQSRAGFRFVLALGALIALGVAAFAISDGKRDLALVAVVAYFAGALPGVLARSRRSSQASDRRPRT